MTLHSAGVTELAEMLTFISEWFAHDPTLESSLAGFTGHPGYSVQQLRDDLNRFVFLIGGNDSGQYLTSHHDQPTEGDTASPGR